MEKTNIYILRLEGGHYYIGKTNNFELRKEQHLNGTASAWTKKHKVVSVEKVISSVSPFDEDRYTKEYMSKYGIDKVRGGSYVEINLDDFQKETLQREIWGAKDLCTRCGRSGHFVKDCHASSDIYGKKIYYDSSSDSEYTWVCEYCDKEFTSESEAEKHEKKCKYSNKSNTTNSVTCYRCGNVGHYSNECYASRHVKGYYL